MIDKNKLLSDLELHKNKQKPYPDDSDNIMYFQVKDIIQSQQKVNDWIPVGERLPKETGDYLCSIEWYGTSTKELLISNGHDIENRIMLIHFLESNKSFKEAENHSTYKVVAWQPLPDPYKE